MSSSSNSSHLNRPKYITYWIRSDLTPHGNHSSMSPLGTVQEHLLVGTVHCFMLMLALIPLQHPSTALCWLSAWAAPLVTSECAILCRFKILHLGSWTFTHHTVWDMFMDLVITFIEPLMSWLNAFPQCLQYVVTFSTHNALCHGRLWPF